MEGFNHVKVKILDILSKINFFYFMMSSEMKEKKLHRKEILLKFHLKTHIDK